MLRETVNYWYYRWYLFIWDFCSAKAIAWPCYITKIRRIYKEKGEKKNHKTSAQTQTKGLKENETRDIFRGFTKTNQLRYEPAQFCANITHPHSLQSLHINFKFKGAQRDTFLRDFCIIKRFPPSQKGFLFLDESLEIIYKETRELRGSEWGFCNPKDLGSRFVSVPSELRNCHVREYFWASFFIR